MATQRCLRPTSVAMQSIAIDGRKHFHCGRCLLACASLDPSLVHGYRTRVASVRASVHFHCPLIECFVPMNVANCECNHCVLTQRCLFGLLAAVGTGHPLVIAAM